MLVRIGNRFAGNNTLQFTERDDGACESNRADSRTKRHFYQGTDEDFTFETDAVSFGCIKSRCRDEYGSQTDKRVERGDQLRQRRHADFLSDHGADRAADGKAEQDHPP